METFGSNDRIMMKQTWTSEMHKFKLALGGTFELVPFGEHKSVLYIYYHFHVI